MKLLKEPYRSIIKKISLTVSLILLLIVLFLGYASNIEIDEGTLEMYHTLDTLFILAIILFVLFAVIAIIEMVAEQKELKEYHKKFPKSKLNKKIYPFDVFNFTFMLLFMILCIFPILYVLGGSFSQGRDYSRGGIFLLPRVFTFENYTVVLKDIRLWKGYLVTIGRTLIGTVTALIYTSIVAYAMSRSNLKFKKIFYWINIVTMFFGGGLIPYFLVIKTVGLYDSFLVYIIPGLYSVYNMIIISGFFKGISNELHEAAIVDGANEFRIYWQIFVPLAKPVLATVALWVAIGHWNSYFDTMIYTHSPNLQTLQYFLLRAIQTSTLTEGMPAEMMDRLSPKTLSLAAIIISMIPVLFFFPFIRKNFQSGIMIGSLKG
ncbi:MAG: carbohydrate ABC transporter permease [Bacillales bacterium]|jgi:putative aldouronate transport system permease protein|nr:carbohydrate ABC transporter permease [Bacillales bacterium]